MPEVSVIMGIYNCAQTLPEAIDSIRAQSFTDWELILCDDGSSDDTLSVARRYARLDERIHVIRHRKNRGLNITLNHCLRAAQGRYIARMDGDDISEPERLEKLLIFLKEHPEYDIVSSAMTCFDADGVWGTTKVIAYPQPMDFLRRSPFAHAASMVTREAFDTVGGYAVDKKLLRVEDYDLWIRMYQAGLIGANLSEPLYRVREGRDAYARRAFRYRLNESYVRLLGVRRLRLPLWTAVTALRPILVGLMPQGVYRYLHRRQFSQQ